MLHFKVTNQKRTLSKHVQFESSFGSYRFKGSADLTKYPESKEYRPVAARVAVFEADNGNVRYLGKVRVRNFTADNRPIEVTPEINVDSPFDAKELETVLTDALQQLKLT